LAFLSGAGPSAFVVSRSGDGSTVVKFVSGVSVSAAAAANPVTSDNIIENILILFISVSPKRLYLETFQSFASLNSSVPHLSRKAREI
jgi:hypothetical protein